MTRFRQYQACASCVLLFLAALLVPAALATAPIAGSIEQREDAFLVAYAEGDLRLCHKRLEQMLLEYPAHPVSVLYYPYLFRLADAIGPAAIIASAEKIRDAIDRSGEGKAGAALLRMNCMIENLRYRLDGERAKSVTDDLKPVRQWTLFGPYRRYGPGDIDRRFDPEIITSGTQLTSRKIAVVEKYDGWLDAGRHLYPARGVVYARVSFNAEGTVKVRVCSDSIYRVFINGRPAAWNGPEDRRSVRVIRITRAGGVTVLVKLWGEPVGKLRLLVTGDGDRNISPITDEDRIFSGECGIEEEPEYPGSIVMAESGPRGDLHRGMYFDGLGSGEAVSWYRTYAVREQSGHALFLLASALLYGGGTRPGPIECAEAQRIFDRIHSACPSYVPARHARLKLLVDRGQYREAYREGKKALSDVSRDLNSCLVFLGLLDIMGRDKEFRDAADSIRKKYPDSPLLLEKEAQFHSGRNPAVRAEIQRELIKKSFSPEQARSFIREMTARGEYESALDVIRSRNYNNDFAGELVELLIKKGDYAEAKSVIFKELMQGDNPDMYQSLGLIDILQSDDPSMYFQKMLDLDPSKFCIDDYIRYRDSGILENPFSGYNGAGINEHRADQGIQQSHADVLYRGRIVILNRDGSSRAYYQDVVRVNDEPGVRRWGTVRLSGSGEFRPVRVRVYGSDGEYADDFSVSRNNGSVCLHIGPLRKNSILHLSYIMDNRVEGSGVISMGPEYLQEYDEPVKRVSFMVIAPEEMKLYFMESRGVRVEEGRSGPARTYSIVMKDLVPVRMEPLPAGKDGTLHAVSFSTVGAPEDFVTWYNGLLLLSYRPLDMDTGRFAGKNVEQTINAVYEFASHEIALEQGRIGSPSRVDETLFRKSGTVEDKVLLARALLERMGIRSYIAFARNKFLPDPGAMIHNGYFTDILLYVPLEAGKALWLDFSSTGLRCGVTIEAVTGADALVIVNDFHYIKKIMSAESRIIQ